MSQAIHSNMETTAESDFVQDFRQNMKFKMATDLPTKRLEENTNQNQNESMKDVGEELPNEEDKKVYVDQRLLAVLTIHQIIPTFVH